MYNLKFQDIVSIRPTERFLNRLFKNYQIAEVKTPFIRDEEKKKLDTQDKTVKRYSEFFEIDEVRALALYNAGYKHLEDFKDAIVDDLIMVEIINPTIARLIIKKMSNEPLKED